MEIKGIEGSSEDRTGSNQVETGSGLFRKLLDYSPDAVFIIDTKTSRFIDANKHACQALGYSRHEILEMSVNDIEASALEEVSWEEHIVDVKTQGSMLVQGRHRRKDGSDFPVEISVSISDDDVELMIAIARDVSERELAREKINSLARIPEENPNPVFRIQFNGTVLYSNQAAQWLMDQWVIGGRADFPPELMQCVAQVLETGESAELRMQVANRIYRHILCPLIDMGYVNVYSEDITRRVIAEEDLKDSQRFAALGSWRMDVVTNEVTWTEELYRMYGLNPTTPPPRYFEHRKLFTRESWKALSDALARTSESGVPYTLELETIKKDGSHGWMWVHGEAVHDAQGRIVAIKGAARDITSSRKILTLLKASEERYRELVEGTDDLITSVDANGNFTYVNHSASKIFGLSPEECIGRSAFDFIHPEDREITRLTFEKWIKDKVTSATFENRQVNRNGQVFDMLWTVFPKFDQNGFITSVGNMARDITERKKAERALREGEQKYHNLFSTMIDGFALHEMIFDENGRAKDYRFLEVNPSFERLTGLKGADIVGRTVLEVLPNTEGFWIDTYGDIVRSGNPQRIENYSEALGKHFEVLAYRTEENRFATVFVDITDRKHMEEQLHQAEKMTAIGQLAGGIAHDFNNQLTAVLGYSDMLVSALHDEELRLYAKNIEQSALRAAALTSQLLAFSRKGKNLSVPVDIHNVLAEVASILEHTIDKRIRIERRLKATTCMTMGDPNQLQNAVLNVALNARDAITKSGEIIFETDVVELSECYCQANSIEALAGMYLKISVTDNGCGMDAATQKRIFEPFFTKKEKGKGTGMGLASVYGTIRNHSGTISVYSEVGHGSTFNIYLPLTDESGEPEESGEQNKTIIGTAKILFVDDETTLQEVATHMLQNLGYEVLTCKNGKDAVEFYEKSWQDIDLVILDMVMPELDGRDTFAAMKQINPKIKAILSSGYSINGEAQKILDDGVMDFIGKPFKQAELSQKVALLLQGE